jgi:hypothetical protein
VYDYEVTAEYEPYMYLCTFRLNQRVFKEFTRARLKSFHFKKTVAPFKIVVVFAEIKTKSADVVVKTTTILKEMRIAQLCS